MPTDPRESPARLSPYLPRPVMTWLADEPDRTAREVEGTLVFADVSGFTALSERLARQGRVGAEILADTISSCFSRLLGAAYSNGGSLLKFGGDALLLLFTGEDHCRRACSAAFGMRRELRALGPLEGVGTRTRLRMSVGVHTGAVHLFLVGAESRELVVAGPAASEVVAMESTADKGQIVVSSATAATLAGSWVGDPKGTGFLLRRQPQGVFPARADDRRDIDSGTLARGLPRWLRQLALAGGEDAQHRNVTVAFLNFRGSDALLRHGGVQAVADELDALVRDTQAAVDRHDVFLLGSDVDRDGGKLVILGGAPVATGHEEESVLCVAREVLAPQRQLHVRVGVHTGSAFAGDIGPSYRRTFTAMGDTVNLAARVMAHAESGTVLATDAVLERSRGVFAVTAVEPFTVKGKSAAVHAAVVGAARDRVAVHDLVRPMIGRDAELSLLLAAWESARAGTGGVVVLGGEPGIGKSRLVGELRRRVEARQLVVCCEQYAANTAYWATRQLLRQALGCTASDDDECVRQRLLDVFADRAAALAPFAPLVGMAAGVELPMTSAVQDLDDRFRRQRLEQCVVELLSILLPEPALFVIEDAHWVDEASAQLLASAVLAVNTAPWLVAATRRFAARGFNPPAGGNVRLIELAPLSDNAATALAEVLATDAADLDPDVVATLVDRSGGNPLFLGELMASVRSRGAEGLPESLEGLILSRIDALAPEDRSLLRRLSVLGATFSHALAREVLGNLVPPPRDAAWKRLAEFVHTTDPARFGFRHALLMDGAYNSLPFRVRESLHAAVGDTIERTAGSAVGDKAEVLSLHFFHAKRFAQAWRYSRLAAERAAAVYANPEAARFLERALEAGKRGADVAVDELLAAHEALGDIRRLMGDLTTAETSYRQARRLSADDPVAQARLLLKQAGIRQQEGAFAQALRWLSRADQLLDAVPGPEAARQRARAAVARASVAKDQGRPPLVVRACERALSASRRSGDREVEAHASLLLDHAQVALGRMDRAVHSARALALFEELGNLWGQGSVLNNLGARAYWNGKWDEAIGLYDRALTAYRRIGDVNYVAYAQVNIAEIRADQGRYDEADFFFEQARSAWERIGDRASIAFALSGLGRLRTRQRRYDEAMDLLGSARSMAQSVGLAADVLDAELRLVECLCHSGQARRALDAIGRLRPRMTEASATQRAMLHRLAGLAQLQRNDLPAAAEALAVSRAEARDASTFELALTLRALAGYLAADGRDPMPLLTEAHGLLTGLGVVAVDEPAAMELGVRVPVSIPQQPLVGAHAMP